MLSYNAINSCWSSASALTNITIPHPIHANQPTFICKLMRPPRSTFRTAEPAVHAKIGMSDNKAKRASPKRLPIYQRSQASGAHRFSL